LIYFFLPISLPSVYNFFCSYEVPSIVLPVLPFFYILNSYCSFSPYISLLYYMVLLFYRNKEMEFVPLSDLKRHDVNAVVWVCVIRKCDFRGLADNGPIQHVDMVLADEKVCFLCIPSKQLSLLQSIYTKQILTAICFYWYCLKVVNYLGGPISFLNFFLKVILMQKLFMLIIVVLFV
jgi:hypothetical protein